MSSKQTDRTDPPPQAQTEQVNAVFTENGKSDDSSKTQKDPPHPIIVKIEKDKPIKTSKRDYHVVKTNEYPFREYIPKFPYPQRLNMDHSHLNRIVKFLDFALNIIKCSWEILVKSPYFALGIGNGYSQKDKNQGQNGQNRARDWNERGKPKPKAYAFKWAKSTH
ncbi:hypothetical protein Tco_0450838 [Tanacetum coccineum]